MDNHQISLKFYTFLCGIIGTEEVVKKRRHILSVMDDRNESRTQMIGGSKGDGLEIKGSDFDKINILNNVLVFERLEELRVVDNKMSLIMDTENTKPGYTKFLLYHRESNFFFHEFVDKKTGLPYLSSTLYRESFFDDRLEKEFGSYIHGPSITTNDEFDLVHSVHCSNWISQARPWISRSKFSWASEKVIQNILNFGVLFVPIGSKHSIHTDLEWRISFSNAEKQLVFSFNHVQLVCYALLKILLNDIIKKTFGDLLCSYFLKTIMFWLCEETEVCFWSSENILECFKKCFQRLVYCVENVSCLHYFIPENNLFENRFEEQHKHLLATLQGLYDSGWTCLLQTETLQPFRNYLEPSLSLHIPFSTYLSCLDFFNNMVIGDIDHVAKVKQCLYQSIQWRKTRDIYMVILSRLFQLLVQNHSNEQIVNTDNKFKYGQLRQRVSYLLIGINHDAVSGWLLLATLFYTNKQYILSKILIDYCLTKFTTERCDLNEEDAPELLQFSRMQDILRHKCLKNYTINFVRFTEKSSIIPPELVEEDATTDIPSLVYTHYLNFLLYHTAGDKRGKRNSYRNLVSTFELPICSTARQRRGANACLAIVENLTD